MNEEIKRQIEVDVTSGENEVQKELEKELETSAKASIKKLQEKWKLSNEEDIHNELQKASLWESW